MCAAFFGAWQIFAEKGPGFPKNMKIAIRIIRIESSVGSTLLSGSFAVAKSGALACAAFFATESRACYATEASVHNARVEHIRVELC